jgi:hypothetical protein
VVLTVNGIELYWEETGPQDGILHMATTDPSSIESMVLVSAPPYFPPACRAIQRQFSEAMLGEAEMTRIRVVPNGGHGPVFGDAAPQFASTALACRAGNWRP